MKTYSPALFSALLISALMLFTPVTQADEEEVDNVSTEQSYGDKVGEKALSGFTNINTAILEIPKNVINTTNNSEYLIYGIAGGLTKGFLHAMGRLASGLSDLLTAPIITKPVVQPDPIWHDFDAETTYGKIFRLDNEPKTGAKNTTNEIYIKVVPAENATDRTTTNTERDRIYKEEMMK